jgi:hypothetical protein
MFLQNPMPMFTLLCSIQTQIPRLEKGSSEMAERGKAVFPFCLRPLAEMEACKAAKSGNPDALRDALDQKGPHPWDHIMEWAIRSGCLECVKVLYDKGYEEHRSKDPCWSPALSALRSGHLEILRFVVDYSGPLEEEDLRCISNAVEGGVEMLQYVQELGRVFDKKTTRVAASMGNLEALRYLHMSGTPWDSETLVAALWADSLPCLEYAHVHGCPQEDEVRWEFRNIAPSLPVLRYVCEHMDSAFAANVLKCVAVNLAGCRLCWEPELLEKLLPLPVVLYLGRKLGTALPASLAQAVASRQERAAALAGAFWKAGKWQRAEEARLLHRQEAGKQQRVFGGEENSEVTHEDAERMATWEAMARVPKELRERIAVEAHLIIL